MVVERKMTCPRSRDDDSAHTHLHTHTQQERRNARARGSDCARVLIQHLDADTLKIYINIYTHTKVGAYICAMSLPATFRTGTLDSCVHCQSIPAKCILSCSHSYRYLKQTA